MIWASFHMFTCLLYILSDEVSIKVSGSFLTGFVVFLLLSFKSSLNIFEFKSFIKHVFRKYFFLFVACFFILLSVAFTEQKFLILVSQVTDFFLSWIVLLVLYIQTHCQIQGHIDFLLLPSRCSVIYINIY